MQISNENWTWARAAKMAHELSKGNKNITYYVRSNRLMGDVWFILDWEPDFRDNRWFHDGSNHRNGERV